MVCITHIQSTLLKLRVEYLPKRLKLIISFHFDFCHIYPSTLQKEENAVFPSSYSARPPPSAKQRPPSMAALSRSESSWLSTRTVNSIFFLPPGIVGLNHVAITGQSPREEHHSQDLLRPDCVKCVEAVLRNLVSSF